MYKISPLLFILISLTIQSKNEFICTRAFQEISDYIVRGDEPLNFDPTTVPEKSIIFVCPYSGGLNVFFEVVFPQLKYPVILISHDSDGNAPYEWTDYLENKKIIVWFAENIAYPHPKLINIPIGIAHENYPGNIDNRVQVIQKQQLLNKNHKKKPKVYLNLSPESHVDREEVIRLYSSKKWATHIAKRIPWEQYINDMSQYQFVFCPRGAGLDCFRTWEALYLGCIPIVKSSTLNPLYTKLPVIVVDDWTDITSNFLKEKYKKIMSSTLNLNKLYMPYWRNLIRSYKKK